MICSMPILTLLRLTECFSAITYQVPCDVMYRSLTVRPGKCLGFVKSVFGVSHCSHKVRAEHDGLFCGKHGDQLVDYRNGHRPAFMADDLKADITRAKATARAMHHRQQEARRLSDTMTYLETLHIEEMHDSANAVSDMARKLKQLTHHKPGETPPAKMPPVTPDSSHSMRGELDALRADNETLKAQLAEATQKKSYYYHEGTKLQKQYDELKKKYDVLAAAAKKAHDSNQGIIAARVEEPLDDYDDA